MQLRRFNYLQRPETDVRGLPNHWHFEVRPMPGVKGELGFIVNPHGRYFHGEGRTQISSLSIPNQAKVIVPLLLEAFVTEFDGMPAPVCRNSAAFAPFSWSTGNQALARAVAARCQAIGIRSELCSVQVSDAQTIRVAGECWVRWEADIMQAMSMFGGHSDDGEENVEVEGGCEYCHITPSFYRPLFPCNQCETTFYCSEECQSLHTKVHSVTCVGALD